MSDSTTTITYPWPYVQTPAYPRPHNVGWECPKCGRVNAPWKESCGCHQAAYPWYPYPYWGTYTATYTFTSFDWSEDTDGCSLSD